MEYVMYKIDLNKYIWAIPNINVSKKGNGLGASTRKYATNSYLRARRSPLQANKELKD